MLEDDEYCSLSIGLIESGVFWTIYLSTDKQFYRPNEKVIICGYVTDNFTHTLSTLPQIENHPREKIKSRSEFEHSYSLNVNMIIEGENDFKYYQRVFIDKGTFLCEWLIPSISLLSIKNR